MILSMAIVSATDLETDSVARTGVDVGAASMVEAIEV